MCHNYTHCRIDFIVDVLNFCCRIDLVVDSSLILMRNNNLSGAADIIE